jgi:hypothetical protein
MDVEGERHRKNQKAKIKKQRYEMGKMERAPNKNFSLLPFAF